MNKRKNGFFICFEGPDGSGKTTLIYKLKSYFTKLYPGRIVTTREPGGTNSPISEKIRDIILDKKNNKITPETEVLLFAASRAQHMHDFILKNIQKNKIIFCDRFIYSSIVYQGIARNLGIENIKKINEFAIKGLYPDLTFFLMLDPKKGINRIKSNKKRICDRLDDEDISLHKKVYHGYNYLLKNDKTKKIIRIDANKKIDEVFLQVKTIIEKYI